jgi:hypothetical protein
MASRQTQPNQIRRLTAHEVGLIQENDRRPPSSSPVLFYYVDVRQNRGGILRQFIFGRMESRIGTI